jgi:hypothetical protein
VEPFALPIDLGERKSPFSVPNIRGVVLNVEPLSDARTTLAVFFSILLGRYDRITHLFRMEDHR